VARPHPFQCHMKALVRVDMGESESADEFSQLLSGISRGFLLEHHTANAVRREGLASNVFPN
jgi:hypothetical protein